MFKPRFNKYEPITAGLHVELGPDGPTTINLVVGGAKKKVEFPLAALLHLEDGDRESGSNEAMVELDIDPFTINFLANKFVTDWQPITSMCKVCTTITHSKPRTICYLLRACTWPARPESCGQ